MHEFVCHCPDIGWFVSTNALVCRRRNIAPQGVDAIRRGPRIVGGCKGVRPNPLGIILFGVAIQTLQFCRVSRMQCHHSVQYSIAIHIVIAPIDALLIQVIECGPEGLLKIHRPTRYTKTVVGLGVVRYCPGHNVGLNFVQPVRVQLDPPGNRSGRYDFRFGIAVPYIIVHSRIYQLPIHVIWELDQQDQDFDGTDRWIVQFTSLPFFFFFFLLLWWWWLVDGGGCRRHCRYILGSGKFG